MSFFGMIVEEVEQLAAQMTQRAEEITQLMGHLTSQLESTSWVGPDRENFHGEWHSSHIPALQNVANALGQAASKAHMNAQQQREASAT